jgi:hemoglobin
MNNAHMTLYEAIGGQPAIMAAVDLFYHRVMGDLTLAPYFESASMQRLKGHQSTFLAQALLGPARYKGRSMREAHAGLGITDEAFNAVAGHLQQTLASLNVPAELIGEVIAGIAPLRDQIVERGEPVAVP